MDAILPVSSFTMVGKERRADEEEAGPVRNHHMRFIVSHIRTTSCAAVGSAIYRRN
jgi:hypothetical protein